MVTPTFEYETRYWDQGIKLIAGIDEVGMGALAGPVTAAAVILDQQFSIFPTSPRLRGTFGNIQFSNTTNDRHRSAKKVMPTIRDSKTMSARQREVAEVWIRENALAWAIGEASVGEIDELNIRKASQLAMRRAVDALKIKPELLLIDGTEAQIHETVPAECIVDGDATCFSISTASILAKVYRDAIMTKLDIKYPGYGLVRHKGYGSSEHLLCLSELGPVACHRKSYAPVARLLETE